MILTTRIYRCYRTIFLGIWLFCICPISQVASQPTLPAPVYQKDSTGRTFLQAVQRYLWTHYEPLLISKCLRARFFMSFEFDSTKKITYFSYPDNSLDSELDTGFIEAAKAAIRSTQAGWEVPEAAINTKIMLWININLIANSTTNEGAQFYENVIFEANLTDSLAQAFSNPNLERTDSQAQTFEFYQNYRKEKFIQHPLSYFLGTCSITVTPEDLNRQKTALSRKARKRLME